MNLPDLQDLPALPFTERAALPDVPAIYFALSETGEVLYIGKTVRLAHRWAGWAHHRSLQLDALPGVRLAWLTVDVPEVLNAVEQACIAYFQPALNGKRVRGERVKSKTDRIAKTVQLPDALSNQLNAESERRGVSGNTLIILALRKYFGLG